MTETRWVHRYEREPTELLGRPVWPYPRERWSDDRYALGPRHDELRKAIGEELDRLADGLTG